MYFVVILIAQRLVKEIAKYKRLGKYRDTACGTMQ